MLCANIYYLLSGLHWSTSLRTVTVLIVNVTQSTITGERLAMRDCLDQAVLWASLCMVVLSTVTN